MGEQRSSNYEDARVLKQIIKNLKGRKFLLDCGHRITFGYWIGNDITIYNGKEPEIICSQCGH